MADTIEGDTVREQHPQAPPREAGPFFRFWTTLPGVLTALAAIVSAAVPLYLHFEGGGGDPAPHADAPPVPATVVIMRDPDRVLDRVGRQDAALRDPVSGCVAGDSRACAKVVESLVEACDDGSPVDCNLLFELTDEGSELEWFGATCGYRFDTDLWAGTCEYVL